MKSIESARVAFAGTPDFAVPSLEALVESGWAVDPVLTQPDRPAGRGRRLTASPVKQAAGQYGIRVLQPEKVDHAFREVVEKDAVDFLVVVAYGLILPQWLLDWPAIAPINVHASLLPRWRGAAPIQHAIMAGDRSSGVSIMRMTRGLDCGPVYEQASLEIDPAETAGALHDRLAELGARLLAETLPRILSGELGPKPQDEDRVTYAAKIEKADAALDWNLPACELARRVRAFNPWPVTETRTTDGERLRIWQAVAVESPSSASPGTIVAAGKAGIDVATASGMLRIRELQPAGGRAMSAGAYLAARDLEGVSFVGPE